MRFQSALIAVVVLAASVLIAEDNLDESKAIEKIELLGGRVTIGEFTTGGVFRRSTIGVGFPEGGPFADQHRRLVNSFKHLTSLRLIGNSFTENAIKDILELKPLKDMTFVGTTITDEQLKLLKESLPNTRFHVDNSDNCIALATIDLLGGKVMRDDTSPDHPVVGVDFRSIHRLKFDPGNDRYLKTLNSFADLKTLYVYGEEITDASLKWICLNLKNLKTIEIQLSEITDIGMERLKELKNLGTLKLEAAKITDKGLSEIKELPNLTVLRLSHMKISDVGMREVNQLKNLEELDLYASKISDDELQGISQLSKLSKLSLDVTKISDEGLRYLKDLKSLTHLAIGWTKITNAGLKELEGLKTLSTLDIRATPITDGGIDAICRLKTLKVISLGQTKITDAGVQKLQEAMPNLQILR